MKTIPKQAQDIAVTEALTLLMSTRVSDFEKMAVQFTVATHNLDQFVIKGKVHPQAPAETLYSTADSFSTPTGLLETSSGDLTTQASGTTGSFKLNVGCYYQIDIYAASVHAAGSLVDIFAGLR